MMKLERFTLIELFISVVITITGLLVVGILACLLLFSTKGCQKIREKGLKNVTTEIWEGPDKE